MNYSTIIYSLLSADTALTTLLGTYTDGANTLNKIFPVLAPLREGTKADYPMIIFQKKIEPTPVKGLSVKQEIVTVQFHVVAEDPNGMEEIAAALRDALDHVTNQTVLGAVVQKCVFVQQDYEMYDTDEPAGVYFIPVIYKLTINKT